ncbi:MAG: hypothetical protein WAO19_10760 [Candidatus Kryptoniota bacterium]
MISPLAFGVRGIGGRDETLSGNTLAASGGTKKQTMPKGSIWDGKTTYYDKE